MLRILGLRLFIGALVLLIESTGKSWSYFIIL